MKTSPHKPVLLDEVIDIFKNIKSGYIVDATLGYAGHSSAILCVNPNINLIGIDRDITAVTFSTQRLKDYSDRFEIISSDFASAITKLKGKNITGVLADIGVSSLQLDEASRGFRFDSDVLDMRMDMSQDFTAKDVVNTYSYDQLEEIFRDYGEVREYKRLSNLIIKHRPFQSSKELSELIAKNFKSKNIHPATLAFQAIRIEVNDELGQLKQFLNNVQSLNQKLTLAVISFHSLEDRIIKQTFKQWSQKCICPKEFFKCECGGNHSKGKIITKKPITPTKEEIKANPRARSSKMRIFRFD